MRIYIVHTYVHIFGNIHIFPKIKRILSNEKWFYWKICNSYFTWSIQFLISIFNLFEIRSWLSYLSNAAIWLLNSYTCIWVRLIFGNIQYLKVKTYQKLPVSFNDQIDLIGSDKPLTKTDFEKILKEFEDQIIRSINAGIENLCNKLILISRSSIEKSKNKNSGKSSRKRVI